jgi:hypothetical protein
MKSKKRKNGEVSDRENQTSGDLITVWAVGGQFRPQLFSNKKNEGSEGGYQAPGSLYFPSLSLRFEDGERLEV